MKKLMKLASVLTIAGMIGSLAATSSAAFDKLEDLVVIEKGVTKKGDPAVAFKAPASGLGAGNGINGWTIANLKYEVIEGDIDFDPEELNGATIPPGAVLTDGNMQAAKAFATDIAAGETAIYTEITFEGEEPVGKIRVTGEMGGNVNVDGEATTVSGIAIDVIVEFEATAPVTETTEETTDEVTTTTEGLVSDTAPTTTTAATTTAATTTTSATTAAKATGTPKGGVALAIIPTIVAAGAAVVASRKSK